MNLSFTVYGTPQPQGSTKAFVPKAWSRAVITADNTKLKPWRQDVAHQAIVAMRGEPPTREAIHISARFYFSKPASLSKRVVWKTTRPDLDKCLRGILDSLTGIVFADDAQVAAVLCSKWFAEGTPERVEIGIQSFPVKAEDVMSVSPAE